MNNMNTVCILHRKRSSSTFEVDAATHHVLIKCASTGRYAINQSLNRLLAYTTVLRCYCCNTIKSLWIGLLNIETVTD